MVMPTLTKTWKVSIEATPTASRLENRLLARVAMCRQRQMMRRKRTRMAAPPRKPNSSPMTEKMKSVWATGRNS